MVLVFDYDTKEDSKIDKEYLDSVRPVGNVKENILLEKEDILQGFPIKDKLKEEISSFNILTGKEENLDLMASNIEELDEEEDAVNRFADNIYETEVEGKDGEREFLGVVPKGGLYRKQKNVEDFSTSSENFLDKILDYIDVFFENLLNGESIRKDKKSLIGFLIIVLTTSLFMTVFFQLRR